jgi:hypothetical protein
MTRARVLTFHIDSDEMAGLTEALDGVADRYASCPDFRGLVCVEHDGLRHEIVVLTLWDGEGLEATQGVSEQGRKQIAHTTDLGVSSRCFDVVRLVPGPVAVERAVAEALAS